MMRLKIKAIPLLFTVMLIASCGDVVSLAGNSWRGSWTIYSATLDGQSSPIMGEWNLADTSWSLITPMCSANGPLRANGDLLSLTVAGTNCPNSAPAPVGQTATGLAEVSMNYMKLTLVYTLDGVERTLITNCLRK